MSENPRHRKLRYNGIDALIHGIQTANENAQSQRTSNSGSVFIPSGNFDENGQPDGTGTIIGSGANGGGIAPWVNDLIPPGKPLGLSVSSKTGMIFVNWDGTIEDGVPNDFDHLQVLVDGADAGWLSVKGTVTSGPYDIGSIHSVTAYAYDNAHSADGKPAPNRSQVSDQLTVTVSGAEIDEESLGITVTKSDKDPQINGVHKGDLWLKYGSNYGENIVKDSNGQDWYSWSFNGVGYSSSVDSNGVKHFRLRPYGRQSSGEESWSEFVYSKANSPLLHNGDTVTISIMVKGDGVDTSTVVPYLGLKNMDDGRFNEGLFPVPVNNSGWVTLTKTVTIKNAKASGTAYRFGFTIKSSESSSNSVVLATRFSMRVLNSGALSNEWWWDGATWVPIPVAIYLDQLAARSVEIDGAVVGALSAGIIKSGSFVTPNGLVGFDTTGFWAKNANGVKMFSANADGVQSVGGVTTATSGNRIQLSQTLVKGAEVGGLQGIGDDPNHPYWLIWGTPSKTNSTLFMGTSPQQPQFVAGESPDGNIASITASRVNITSGNFSINGIAAGYAEFIKDRVITWAPGYEDYNGATRLYERGGVIFLELNVKKSWGIIPPNQTITIATISSDIASTHSLDVLAYGTSYAVGRYHVFGNDEGRPRGTISVGTKDTTANFFSAQMFWLDPRSV